MKATLATTATLEVAGGSIDCSIVPWDSEIFGFPVAVIDRIELREDHDPAGLLTALDGWCEDRDVRLVSCRIDHLRLRESMALEDRGFRFVEMVYVPGLETFDSIGEPRHAIIVTEAGPADLAEIERIAYSAFTTGRYLLDWRLPPELSRRRYAQWVRNSRAAGQAILKADFEDRIVGFFIVEERIDRSAYWHLTAIAPEAQGQGLGLSLWQTMLRRHRDEGVIRVQTTVSAHNPAVINLYARLRFTFQSPQMTFHWLRRPIA
ncbi:MAG: hypothetical protein QOF49_1861 [Chloroflexota bacterium]|jgi:ribosomal protein S18 acetylase RimI-like enzyme|nr:hypothetical protein [Chloroflexota bacterium]